MKIKDIAAREVLDSRGNPTVSASVVLEDGTAATSSVPSGASTGAHEVLELRDNDEKRFLGQGVLTAVNNVNNFLKDIVIGMDAIDQRAIDQKMIDADGTEDKSKFGANAILAVSLAVARAEALAEGKELFEYLAKYNTGFSGRYIMPIPEMNVLNGGKHANWATDIQEYMLFPLTAPTFRHAVQMNVVVYHCLKNILKERELSILVGDEGGFAPSVSSNSDPFELLIEAIKRAGFAPGEDIALGIDAAASEFYENGVYKLKKEGRETDAKGLSAFYRELLGKYPIVSVEDPFFDDDWEAFRDFTRDNEGIQIVGDDLFVTNVRRLQKGIDEGVANSILIKVNQIGTLTETIDAILLAKKHNYGTIISHRSGETEDTFIADLAVAMGVGQIKSGAPARSERVAKYNRLMLIEEMLGERASLWSGGIFQRR